MVSRGQYRRWRQLTQNSKTSSLKRNIVCKSKLIERGSRTLKGLWSSNIKLLRQRWHQISTPPDSYCFDKNYGENSTNLPFKKGCNFDTLYNQNCAAKKEVALLKRLEFFEFGKCGIFQWIIVYIVFKERLVFMFGKPQKKPVISTVCFPQ